MRPYFFSSLSVKNCVGPPVSLFPQKLPVMVSSDSSGTSSGPLAKAGKAKKLSAAEREALIRKLTAEMKNAAKILEFEHAAYLRDKIEKLRNSK